MPFPLFTPVLPNRFTGRKTVIDNICSQLDHPERRSTALVGGPSTGRTSLLRYLTSKHAQTAYPSLANSWNVYISGDAIGHTATPTSFWVLCFREIKRQVNTGDFTDRVLEMIKKTENAEFDFFDLEDFFDECASNNILVVLVIDDFVNLLKNINFWPPDDFFHHVRSLGQRVPRGLSFIVGTPRPLTELWDPSRNASPFYNIFLSVPIGRLAETEIRDYIQKGFASLGISSNEETETFIIQASEQHPALVNYAADLCASMIQTDGQISVDKLYQAYNDPSGPVVTLIRRIREHLPAAERQWLDTAREFPQNLSSVQIGLLRKLWEHGMIPPGVKIP